MSVVTGAVNGVPTVANVAVAGVSPVTIPFFPGGAISTLGVDTDGSGLHTPNHRVAVICGNSSGRDHFPFAVEDDLSGAAGVGFHQRGIDLASAMQSFWLVKKWHLVGSFDWNVHNELGDYGYEATFDATLNTGSVYHYPLGGGAAISATTESGLVLPSVIATDGTVVDITNTFDSSHGELSEGGWSLMDNGGGDVPLYYADGLLYPLFQFGAVTAAGITDGDDVEIGIAFDNTGLTECSGHLEMNFIEYTLYVISQGANLSGDVHVDIAITPIEFWPYATKSGDPVYDTSIGEQLNNPLS